MYAPPAVNAPLPKPNSALKSLMVKVEPDAVGVKNPDTAVNALGEVMQMMAAVVVVLPGHAVILDFH